VAARFSFFRHELLAPLITCREDGYLLNRFSVSRIGSSVTSNNSLRGLFFRHPGESRDLPLGARELDNNGSRPEFVLGPAAGRSRGPGRWRVAGRSSGIEGEAGFALILTLVVILALSLITLAMTQWLWTALDQAKTNRDRAVAERTMAEAEAVSLYLLATRPLSFRGLELPTPERLPSAAHHPLWVNDAADAPQGISHIRLDDHPYLLQRTVVRFQDARGLINLNLVSEGDIYSLLGIFGVAEGERDPLIAKLQDYTDRDSLVRLNGAEAPQYEDLGLEPPANAPLRTPWEVLRVIDWDKVEGIARDGSQWSLLTSTAPINGLNINTAPRALLELMPLMTPDSVDRVIARRVQQPIIDALEFGAIAGITMADGPSRFGPFPSNSLILTMTVPSSGLERRVAVRLMPNAPDRPWRIDYDVELPPAERDGGGETPDELDLPLQSPGS